MMKSTTRLAIFGLLTALPVIAEPETCEPVVPSVEESATPADEEIDVEDDSPVLDGTAEDDCVVEDHNSVEGCDQSVENDDAVEDDGPVGDGTGEDDGTVDEGGTVEDGEIADDSAGCDHSDGSVHDAAEMIRFTVTGTPINELEKTTTVITGDDAAKNPVAGADVDEKAAAIDRKTGTAAGIVRKKQGPVALVKKGRVFLR